MFKIYETPATVRSINPRAENHGDETALACDIGLEFTVSNKMLELLAPGLLACLYKSDPDVEASGQDALELEEDMLPHKRFPQLGKLPWGYEGAGYTFQLIDDTLHGDKIIEVTDCKINKFNIECEEGGTVILQVRVQGSPDEETIGELCHFIKSEVRVSLLPPALPEQADIDDEPFHPASMAEDTEERPDDEAMYAVAVEQVQTSGIAAVKNLADAMQITVERAVSLLDRMEQDGIVGEPDKDGTREVLDVEGAA